MTTNKKSKQIFLTKTITTILTTAFVLSSCKENQPDRTTARGRGQYQAGVIKHEVHAAYLSCYPLDPREKLICLNKISDQYLKEEHQRDYESYVKALQYESEKLGFKYFLKTQ